MFYFHKIFINLRGIFNTRQFINAIKKELKYGL